MTLEPSNSDVMPLFPDPEPAARYFGESPLETEVRKACEKATADRPNDFILPVLSQVAQSLALNIAKGNAKGRAIANEAMQLASVLAQIKGEEIEEDESALPQATRDLIDALRTVPRTNGPAAGYKAQS